MPDRLYCTVADVVGWGVKNETELMSFIRSASDWISKNIGNFIPVIATKNYDGTGDIDLTVAPVLSITSITDDGDTLSADDYILYPRNKWWENGPYTRLRTDPDSSLGIWTNEEDAVEITGVWGLYSETADTGATVQDDPLVVGATSLLVDNGASVFPGHNLLIGTEQILVLETTDATDSTTNTDEAIDNAIDHFDVVDGSVFNPGEIILVENEKMLILGVVTNTLIVTRGFYGTSREAHLTNQDIYVYRTYKIKRGVNGSTAAEHAQSTAISRYIAPWEVNYLCKQMASIMSKKADSSYAGKTGNIDLGEVFYHDEFPNSVLKNIKRGYMPAKRHSA